MTLPASGSISLSAIHQEFSGDTAPTTAGPLELGEYYGQDNAPTSGAISFSNFYGTDGVPASGLQLHWDGQISESNTGTGGVEDIGTFDRNGTLTNGASYSATDKGIIVLDGTNDSVNFTGYVGVTTATARTSIAFVKLDSQTPADAQRVFAWGNPATNGRKWSMELLTNARFNMGVGGGYRQSYKTFTLNQWNMFSATWGGGNGFPPTDPITSFAIVGTVVSGTGVPNGTTVTAVDASTNTITLSNNLSSTISGTTLTFTNNYLIATGGSGGGGGGANGGGGGSSSGISRTNGGSGGSGGSGATDGGGGAGAGGYTGNGGGENQNGSGGGGAGGANDGDGGGGVGIYGAGSSGTAPRGGGSGGVSGQNTSGTGGDGGNYGGGGGGVRGNNGSGTGGDGGDGAVRFVWSGYSYPSNAANGISNQQTFTSSGTFTVPAGVTSISAVVVGGGGGGGDNDPDKDDEGGGGGGGGALAYGSWTVSAGQQYTVSVGSGGNGGNGDGSNGSSGGSSSISASDTASATGTVGTNTIVVGTPGGNDTPNITLYHNAQQLVNYSTLAQTIDTSNDTDVQIGTNQGNSYVDGQVAKVLIYNRALSHSEIAQIYNAKAVALGLSQAAATTETAINIEYVKAGTHVNGSSSSFTITGIQSGDFILVAGASDSTNITGPTGFTNGGNDGGSTSPVSYWGYVFSTGTSYTVSGLQGSGTSSNGCAYIYMVFRNVNATTPIDVSSGPTGSLDPPSITTNFDGCMIVALAMVDDDNQAPNVTAPSGYTLAAAEDVGTTGNDINGATVMGAYLAQTSAGVANPGAFTIGSTDSYDSFTIALRSILT